MKKHTILWADDDPDDLSLFKQILQELNQNYHIIEAENGTEALQHLEQMKKNHALPDLVILDINMPVMNGRDTLVKIKDDKQLQGLPVVVLTTSTSELDGMFCKKYGVERFIKPPSYIRLKDTLQNILNATSINK